MVFAVVAIVALIICGAVVAALAALWLPGRARAGRTEDASDGLSRSFDPTRGFEPTRSFDPNSYAPMRRLLLDEDLIFLKSQRGFQSGMDSRLRSERRSIFRLYLRRLDKDFRSLHLQLHQLILSAPEDQSVLLRELFRQNTEFRMRMLRVEFDLLLHSLHLSGVPAGATRLIEAAERLSLMKKMLLEPQMLQMSA
jgi:hypothetical protein